MPWAETTSTSSSSTEETIGATGAVYTLETSRLRGPSGVRLAAVACGPPTMVARGCVLVRDVSLSTGHVYSNVMRPGDRGRRVR